MISNELKIKLQDYFLGKEEIEGYIIHKEYLSDDQNRQIFFAKIKKK